MKKFVKLLVVVLVVLLCVGSASVFASSGNSYYKSPNYNDAAWRAQKTAGQGIYYNFLSDWQIERLDKTTIYRSHKSPTGFFVTFRYKNAKAARVRIAGEWLFTTRFDATVEGIKLYNPEEWTKEMFPMIPDIQGTWKARDMKFNAKTGIWHFTIPLPSGTFTYQFIVGGDVNADVNDFTGATRMSDPCNPPFEDNYGEQPKSQVRVPFDDRKQDDDHSIEMPRKDKKVGLTEIVYYPVKNSAPIPDGKYELGIYLPYGYNPNRSEPYKVMYLSHGAGITENTGTSWYNKGSVSFMMDNLIAQKKVEPFVLVTIHNYFTPIGSTPEVGFVEDNLINNILPFVESNYNVAKDDSGRALAGLSAGGSYTYRTLLKYPQYFNYYGFMSASGADTFTVDKEELKDAHLYISVGMQELMKTDRIVNRLNLMYNLAKQGVYYDIHLPEGGHQWTVWREQFVDFCRLTLWK